ncbi:hypothetical protein RHDC2_00856 [Rhodocyclaceae bacterium]|nr:hypothetical protein RHDC2_00856 [Rhodocyclaceae bacterium]
MPGMDTESHLNAAPSPALTTALRRLLRPLVRIMLAQGVTYPFLSELLKSVFVEVADKEFRLGGRQQTDSRISLLSGVHRKDVKRLRNIPDGDESAPAAISLGAALVACWVGSPEYLDAQGKPMPLARLASVGGAHSFEGLIASVSKDIRSRVVLDEWLRLGVVRIDDQDCVCLNSEAFVPEKGFDEKAYYFGANIHDHLAACAHNLMGNQPPLLERSVYYDQLNAVSVEELAKLSRDLGNQVLQKINRRALELQRQNENQPEANQRMNFGVYFYTETDTTVEGENGQP